MNSPQSLPADWLVGKWQSNRDKTIEAWGEFPPGSPAFLALIQRDLGQLVITYDGSESTSVFCGSRTTSTYRVAWQSSNSAFVITFNEEEESGQHIHFISPALHWIYKGRFIEYFSKVANV